MAFLQVRDLSKAYDSGWTLSEASFVSEEADILCLLGPSGCGKTTLLRLIAGLESPESGQILVGGQDVTHVPPHRRGFGLMFQEYALFPHKDVLGNVAFGLRMAGWRQDALRERAGEVLELVGLAGFEKRDVNQLSGGERQRVALARSLAPHPRLLLLDEPLGALDRRLRERLLEELPAILKRACVTTITVTHDQEEAFAIGDQVVVLQSGRVMQQGTPREVYRSPTSPEVARFLGLTNLLAGRLLAPGRVATSLAEFQIKDDGALAPGTTGFLLVRPEAGLPDGMGPNTIHGTVLGISFRGSTYRLELGLDGGVTWRFEWAAGRPAPRQGERLTLALDPAGLVFLEANAGLTNKRGA